MTLQADNLMVLDQYQQHRNPPFHSRESLRWFIRQHTDELMRRGAVIAPTGRKLIVVDKFDQAVAEIGAARAAKLRA